jgi:hypothetical protein
VPEALPITKDSESSAEAPNHEANWRLWGVTAAILVCQFSVLMARTLNFYRRFNLSVDYSTFEQAWHQIAIGDHNPIVTLGRIPYWKSHFEIIMWPLSLLYRFNHNDGLTLLILQNLAIVLAEALSLRWIVEVARHKGASRNLCFTIAVATSLLFAANPWIYRSAAEDFHFHAISACFALGAGWDLWAGRYRRGTVWVALGLASGDVGATYLAALGLAFLLTTRGRRRPALALTVISIGWVLLVGALDANRGSALGGYAYLTGRPIIAPGAAGLLSIIGGSILHPTRPLRMVARKAGSMLRVLAPSGMVGVLNPWVGFVALVVLTENGLHSNPFFIMPMYQNLPAYLFSTAATGLVLAHLAGRHGRWTSVMAAVIVTVGIGVAFDLGHFSRLDLYHVDSETASGLAALRAHVTDDMEVISTAGVIGRFSGRANVQLLPPRAAVIPVTENRVLFVVAPSGGNQPLPTTRLVTLRDFIQGQLDAKEFFGTSKVWAYLWSPPPSTTSVSFPDA